MSSHQGLNAPCESPLNPICVLDEEFEIVRLPVDDNANITEAVYRPTIVQSSTAIQESNSTSSMSSSILLHGLSIREIQSKLQALVEENNKLKEDKLVMKKQLEKMEIALQEISEVRLIHGQKYEETVKKFQDENILLKRKLEEAVAKVKGTSLKEFQSSPSGYSFILVDGKERMIPGMMEPNNPEAAEVKPCRRQPRELHKVMEELWKTLQVKSQAFEEDKKAFEEDRLALEKTKHALEEDQEALRNERLTFEEERKALEVKQKKMEEDSFSLEVHWQELEGLRQALKEDSFSLTVNRQELKALRKGLEEDKQKFKDERQALEEDWQAFEVKRKKMEGDNQEFDKKRLEFKEEMKAFEVERKKLEEDNQALEVNQKKLEEFKKVVEIKSKKMEEDSKVLEVNRHDLEELRRELEGEEQKLMLERQALLDERQALEEEKQKFKDKIQDLVEDRQKFIAERQTFEQIRVEYEDKRRQLVENQKAIEEDKQTFKIKKQKLVEDRETFNAERQNYEVEKKKFEEDKQVLEEERKTVERVFLEKLKEIEMLKNAESDKENKSMMIVEIMTHLSQEKEHSVSHSQWVKIQENLLELMKKEPCDVEKILGALLSNSQEAKDVSAVKVEASKVDFESVKEAGCVVSAKRRQSMEGADHPSAQKKQLLHEKENFERMDAQDNQSPSDGAAVTSISAGGHVHEAENLSDVLILDFNPFRANDASVSAAIKENSDADYHKAQAQEYRQKLDEVTARLAHFEEVFSNSQRESVSMHERLRKAETELELIPVLKDQLEVYQLEFAKEREEQARMAAEKQQLIEEIHNLRAQNQQFHGNIQNLEQREARENQSSPDEVASTITPVGGVYPRMGTSNTLAAPERGSQHACMNPVPVQRQTTQDRSARGSSEPMRYTCPKCFKTYVELGTVEVHVNQCLVTP